MAGERDDPEVAATCLRVADAIGGLMEFWGFKRPMGRVWTLLYLSPEPLGAVEIGEVMKMSAGAVSMTLAELVKWGTVRKSWRPGERRDYFEAETSIWKMVSRVVRERELTLVREAGRTFANAERILVEAARAAPREQARRRRFARERIANLRTLAKLGESLLESIVAGQGIAEDRLRAIPGQDEEEP